MCPLPRPTQLLLGIGLLALQGCAFLPSHLHSAEDAAVARKTQTELAAYDEAAPAMYMAMLTNLGKVKVEQDRVLADLAANRDRAMLTDIVLNLTTEDVTKRQGNVNDTITRIDGRIKKGVEDYFRDRKEALAAQQDAKAAIEALNNKIDAAKRDADRWSKAIALINKGLAAVPTVGGASAAKNGPGDFIAQLGDVAKMTVEYRKSDGTRGNATILSILKESVQATGPDGERLATLLSAQGIDGTIMLLGLDLARASQRLADARLMQLARRRELYEDSYSSTQLAGALMTDLHPGSWPGTLYHNLIDLSIEARQEYANMSRTSPDAASSALRLGRIKEYTTRLDTMTGRLAAVRRMVVADAILARTEETLGLATARLDHEDSVIRSRAADESWRVVLRSGVSGLVAYHDGGFTSEDAANIIRIAQAIALVFIAGGVQ